MFLWVRLVLKGLEYCESIRELKDAVEKLPKGLDKAHVFKSIHSVQTTNNDRYGHILRYMTNELNEASSRRAIQILEWIACSFRTMKRYEIQDGILFHTRDMKLSDQTKLHDSFWELCKPIIEEGPKNSIDFVHYSAKE